MLNLIRALIFDMDGVLADTLPLHYQSWKLLAEEVSIPFSHEVYDRMRGLTRHECLPVLLNGRTLSPDEAEDWLRRKNWHYVELLNQLTPADRARGVTDLLTEARAAGLKLGVGSSSRNTRRVLDRLGLLDIFDVCADGLTVARNKPSPDIYLWVADRLGVTPPEAIVFEDSAVGLMAAQAGGFWSVDLGNNGREGAHLSVSSLADVSLERLSAALHVSFPHQTTAG